MFQIWWKILTDRFNDNNKFKNPRRINAKTATFGHIVIKLLKTSDKGKTLKAAWEMMVPYALKNEGKNSH